MVKGPVLRWPEARRAKKATFSMLFTFTAPGWSWKREGKLEKYVFQKAFVISPNLLAKVVLHSYSYPLPNSFGLSSLWAHYILLDLPSLNKACIKERAEHFTLVVAFNHPENPISGCYLLLFYI